MPETVELRWPDDVLEQWLYDHANNDHLLRDYGSVDLTTITWSVEAVPLEELIDIPTGASDADCIDYYATDPAHWIRVRNLGVHTICSVVYLLVAGILNRH
ncbi:hypothetical protein [Aeromicrobium sp. 9AM]|uniref:hypothetical protein n=1 Tax=Aeromicrobium sp. 9AM TaxID=2653126 RepID=UPI0012F3DE7D|nr:hypothetical protein [Aeromicrobium sp. 9AM]VXB08791.1 conserved hypothetical protein [Aeromicrobium sp. 9AM]